MWLKPWLISGQKCLLKDGTVMQEGRWDTIPAESTPIYPWDEASTYIRLPSFFQNISMEVPPLSQSLMQVSYYS